MSTILRLTSIRALRALGIRRFLAKSSLGHPFVCHLGDSLGENPFYNRDAFRIELRLCAAWLESEPNPVVFDVGANVGFWSTHLAQMLRAQSVQVYAFEAAPPTFRKLVESVELLKLESSVHPIAAAVLDKEGPVRLSYSSWDSQWAQVSETLNERVGDRMVFAAATTLDGFSSAFEIIPNLIKMDVEGTEIAVLRGARNLLQSSHRPCIAFEYNPLTLSEVGEAPAMFSELLAGYRFFYVDDFEGQRKALGDPITALPEIDWACNIFAVPVMESGLSRWREVIDAVKRKLSTKK